MMSDYEQLSFFSELGIVEKTDLKKKLVNEPAKVSEKTLGGFSIVSIPFLGCDFEFVYPILADILPKEKIVFTEFPLNVAIVCEMICAAICHQMNWDFLRKVVYEKSQYTIKWLSADYLSSISETEVFEMFSAYTKSERIREKERTMLLHSLGEWLNAIDSAENVFLDKNGSLLNYEEIRNNLLTCKVFANDPEEKKMQLLLQKLSTFSELSGLAKYYQPAIDYHLVRCYLRRGLLLAKNKYAKEFLKEMNIERKESTMAAIRQLCSKLLLDICEYTDLNTCIVNQIEWHIGRSVCVRDEPDCFLKTQGSQWVKRRFEVCPYFDTCLARSNSKLLHLNEPIYKGSSY